MGKTSQESVIAPNANRVSIGDIRRSKNKIEGLAEQLEEAARAGPVGVTGEDIQWRTSILRTYRLSRSIARPVERILYIYNDHRTSLYKVLGLARDCSDEDIKQAYRAYALLVHPDKNPHPQAKAAFDAIQDAFRTLSSPLTRLEYDRDFARRRKLTFKRAKKKVIAFFVNNYSNFQLLYVNAMRGEVGQIRNELLSALQGKLEAVQDKFAHFQLLPSYADRVKLLHEIIGDQRYTLAFIITCMSIL